MTEEGLPPAALRSATSGNSTLMKGASQRLRPREATDGGTHSWTLGALSGLAAAVRSQARDH